MKRESFIEILTGIKASLALNKDTLCMEETALYLGMKKSYLYKLTSDRKIPHYKSQGGKMLFFKRKELDEWMTSYQVKMVDEIRVNNIKK